MRIRKLKLRCYVCGGKLGPIFFLASQGNNQDRVLVIEAKCINRLDDQAFCQKVRVDATKQERTK